MRTHDADRAAAFYKLYQKIGPGQAKQDVLKLFPDGLLVEKPAPDGETNLFIRDNALGNFAEKYAFSVTISTAGFVKRKILSQKK